MVLLIIVSVLFLCLLILYIISPIFSPKKIHLENAHVVVTGGSLGIGKAVAVELAKRGANITLMARNQARLEEAKEEAIKHFKNSSQTIHCLSVDLSKDYAAIESVFLKATEQNGPVDVLINCAGFAVSRFFEETPIDAFQKMMDVNYFGALYASRAVISDMKQRNRGRIVFVSSMGGQFGLTGYAGYCGSKFALRGLGEALQMEVAPYNIRVTMVYPPDTDTPGFVEENKGKPKETMMISEGSGLFQPEYVAKRLLHSMARGKFHCSVGMDGMFLTILTAGMSPVTSLMEMVQQVFLMGIIRAISLFNIYSFYKIMRKSKKEKDKTS